MIELGCSALFDVQRDFSRVLIYAGRNGDVHSVAAEEAIFTHTKVSAG